MPLPKCLPEPATVASQSGGIRRTTGHSLHLLRKWVASSYSSAAFLTRTPGRARSCNRDQEQLQQHAGTSTASHPADLCSELARTGRHQSSSSGMLSSYAPSPFVSPRASARLLRGLRELSQHALDQGRTGPASDGNDGELIARLSEASDNASVMFSSPEVCAARGASRICACTEAIACSGGAGEH